MSKSDLYNAFDQKISKLAIVLEADEYVIRGKFCQIAALGENTWDIWVCNPDDLTKGLGTGKMRNISAVLQKSPSTDALTELNGESYIMAGGTETILENLKLLGIRKKKAFSLAHMEKLHAGLKSKNLQMKVAA